MLQECIEVFEGKLKKYTDQWLLDNYVPKDGTYVLINMQKDFLMEKNLNIKTDKKTGEVQGDSDSDYKYIAYLDYYSKLIEMNKPVDSTKIIHSNNIYAFFVKKESLQGKLTDKSIDGYYSVLQNPYQKYTKNNDKILYRQVEEQLGEIDTAQLETIHRWIKDNLTDFLANSEIDTSRKDYLKLFFIGNDREESKELIRREGQRYLLPNIFNKNDYNKNCENGIKGLPGNNMGMNSKKPYLENKTRKTKVPYMLDINKAMLQAQFFDYLAGQASKGNNNIYVDLERDTIEAFRNNHSPSHIETGIYLRIQQGKELEIHNVDRITGYRNNLKRDFYMKNVMEVQEEYIANNGLSYGKNTKLSEVETLVDDIFFGKRLKYNYFTKPEDMSFNDSVLKNTLLMYREQFWAWFYKGDMLRIEETVNEIAIKLIMESLQNDNNYKAKHQINLWISLVDYFNENRRLEQDMEDTRAKLKEHIDCKDEWEFTGDKEYYYAVGQLLNIFLKLSRGKNKSLSLVNPVLNAKKDKVIKDRMVTLFKKYNYAIDDNDFRIKNLLNHVMCYIPETKIDTYMVTAGFVANNLMYEKKQQETDEQE